ncbi:MAG: hypothetical protein ACE5GE_11800 [Phycisphaerae bacterium]
MGVTLDVISIGSLSCNPFWNETGPVRPAHATTTLIREGAATILVDPSLPPEMLAARLHERTGLKPEQIKTVFLTSFRPVHRRGLELFAAADWLIADQELQAVIDSLSAAVDDLGVGQEVGVSAPEEIERELALARRAKAAPDRLTPSVQLFPSPGATVGSAGLIVSGLKTTVVAGDAVLTSDHFEHSRVFERSADPAQARRSFADIVEVADLIVPGHDNLIVAV